MKVRTRHSRTAANLQRGRSATCAQLTSPPVQLDVDRSALAAAVTATDTNGFFGEARLTRLSNFEREDFDRFVEAGFIQVINQVPTTRDFRLYRVTRVGRKKLQALDDSKA